MRTIGNLKIWHWVAMLIIVGALVEVGRGLFLGVLFPIVFAYGFVRIGVYLSREHFREGAYR